MSNLVNHAKRELAVIGMGESAEGMDADMRDHLIHMVEEFAAEGHSGYSASYAANTLALLFKYQPLAPLTGEDSEWNEVGQQDGFLYQNNRCSHVFKDNNGAYDIDGKVFETPDGSRHTNFQSRVPVTFPYTPKTEYVKVDAEGNVLQEALVA